MYTGMRHRAAIAALAAAVSALLAVAPADAQVIFEDDFEDAIVNGDGTIGGWDGPADLSTMYLTGQQAFSGRRSLELKYLPGTHGASFMYRLFTGRDRIHLRWYQRWSPGFIWEPSATKMVILRPMGGYPQFYPEVLWANGQLAIQAQVIAEANWDSRNFYQNVGVPVVFGPDRWYCIEVFVKLNRPGSADGELAAWIDGELKLSYAGRRFRGDSPLDPAPSTAMIQAAGLTGYYGGITPVLLPQTSWQDDVVASADRLGCDLVSEDFEACPDAGGTIPGWDGPSNPSTIYTSDREFARGQRSLELAYQAGSYSAGYAYRPFHGQERVFVRWFQRWSDGFQWAPSTTGLIGLRPVSGYPHFYPFAAGQNGLFAIQAQVLADRQWGSENFFQNEGPPVAFEPRRWYCIEVMVQLNAPGHSDGAIAAWIDDDRKLFYDGRALRGTAATDPSPPTARLSQLLVVGQYSADTTVPLLQTSWQDDLIVSSQRIGCHTPARAVR